LDAACRKNVSRHATVAWRKRNLTRNIRIQESRESSKEIAAAEARMDHHAKVAHRKRNVVGKIRTRNSAVQGTSKSRTLRRREWATKQGNNRTRKRDPKELRWESTGNVIQDIQKDHWTRVRGASWQIYSWVAKNKKMDLVER
jgi:hypothetical protein